jgi:hypothetical protein
MTILRCQYASRVPRRTGAQAWPAAASLSVPWALPSVTRPFTHSAYSAIQSLCEHCCLTVPCCCLLTVPLLLPADGTPATCLCLLPPQSAFAPADPPPVEDVPPDAVDTANKPVDSTLYTAFWKLQVCHAGLAQHGVCWHGGFSYVLCYAYQQGMHYIPQAASFGRDQLACKAPCTIPQPMPPHLP